MHNGRITCRYLLLDRCRRTRKFPVANFSPTVEETLFWRHHRNSFRCENRVQPGANWRCNVARRKRQLDIHADGSEEAVLKRYREIFYGLLFGFGAALI